MLKAKYRCIPRFSHASNAIKTTNDEFDALSDFIQMINFDGLLKPTRIIIKCSSYNYTKNYNIYTECARTTFCYMYIYGKPSNGGGHKYFS